MGGGNGHYNAFQKQRLGWLDYNLSPPITTVPTSGTYTIDAYELPGTAPKALKIARGTTGQAFFVELRRPMGWDANLYRTGVFIHLASDSQPDSSSLLDMTPGTSPLSDDAFLDVGKSFTDPVSGVTLTTLSVSSTSATIMVDMDPPRAPGRRRASPPRPRQSPAVQPGTAVTYTVSVTNTDTAGCAASTFALQATAAHHELAEELRPRQPDHEPRRDGLHDPADHVPRRARRLLHDRRHRDQHHGLDALRLGLGASTTSPRVRRRRPRQPGRRSRTPSIGPIRPCWTMAGR